MFAFALLSARAQNIIITGTYDDWTNWNGGGTGGYTVEGVNTFDYGNITTNGIGNPTDAGGTSLAGALQVSAVTNGWGPAIEGPGATEALLTDMDGPSGGWTSGSLVAQTGTLFVYYTKPDYTNSGTHWDFNVFHNYDGGWGFWSPSSTIDLGPVSTPSGTEEMYEAVVPYTIIACSLSYFHLGYFNNTDYKGAKPWYIASIQVLPLPATIIPAPITPLFTTYNDFGPFTSAGGDLVQADNAWSFDNDTTNGFGNTNAPGAIGTSGSLLLYWSSLETGYGQIANGPDEEYNAAFLQVIDPGCNPATQTSVSAYGNIYMDFSMPDNSGGGTYFQLGVDLAYSADGYYKFFSSSGTTDLHVKDNNGYEVYKATIPYTINAGNLYGFRLNIMANSDYQPTNGFHIDNITVSAAQAPLITGVSLNGSSLAIQGTNGLTGYQFTLLTTTNLLSTTNLALSLSQWTIVSAGNPFNGPTYSITNTINPANARSFYGIKVP